MTDCLIRILHHIGRQTQRELEHHKPSSPQGTPRQQADETTSYARRIALVPGSRTPSNGAVDDLTVSAIPGQHRRRRPY